MVTQKNIGGCPRLLKGKKGFTLQFCVNESQMKFLIDQLERSHYHSVSELVRDMLFNRQLKILTERACQRELLRELAKIGANINQITHRCNVDAIGGTTSRLHISDKYIINSARKAIDNALKKGLL